MGKLQAHVSKSANQELVSFNFPPWVLCFCGTLPKCRLPSRTFPLILSRRKNGWKLEATRLLDFLKFPQCPADSQRSKRFDVDHFRLRRGQPVRRNFIMSVLLFLMPTCFWMSTEGFFNESSGRCGEVPAARPGEHRCTWRRRRRRVKKSRLLGVCVAYRSYSGTLPPTNMEVHRPAWKA